MTTEDKFKKIKEKAKPISLIALSVIGSIASKILAEKFERQVNIQDINVTIYNYIINSLSESSILEFFSQFESKADIEKPSEELSEIDMAYSFIMKNIQLKGNKGVDISFQKDENSIIINYIFNKEYTDIFYEKGLSPNEVFCIAQTVGETGMKLSECLKENLGFTVPIKIKVFTNNGDLLIFVEDGELKELNGIHPKIKLKEI